MLAALLLVACRDPGPAKEDTDRPVEVPETTSGCSISDECDDGNPCTIDFCSEFVCDALPMGCNEPPAASCADDLTLRSWSDIGTCGGGVCEYEPTDVACELGCEDGACLFAPIDLVEWVQPIIGTEDLPYATIAAAADGDVVVVTSARDLLDVGGTEVLGEFRTVISRFAPDGSVRWARALHAADPDNSYDEVMQIGSAPGGELYVGGTVNGAVRFGPGTAEELAVPSSVAIEQPHGVVARLSDDGTPVWATDVGVDASVQLTSLAALDGGVVVAGAHAGAMTLDQGAPGETTLTGDPLINEVFVARYDADGALTWAWDGPPGVATALTATDERLFVSAWYTADATLDNGDLLVTHGGQDAVVLALSFDGAVEWSDTLTSSDYHVVSGLSGTSDGGVALAGSYGEAGTELIVSPGTPEETVLPARGMFDLLIAKWDAAGVLAWTRTGSAPVNALIPVAQAAAVAASDDGSIEVVGEVFADLTIEDGAGLTLLPAMGPESLTDLWYVRYDADGTLLHAGMAGGAGLDGGYGVAWDGLGPVVVGKAMTEATFGRGEANETTVDLGYVRGVAVFGLSR